MSERRKSVPEALVEQGLRVASRAAKAVLEDPRGQEVLATVVGAAQKRKRQFEEVQGQILRVAGLPTKGDYDEVTKSMARLKRKIRDISRKVEAPPAGEGNGERKR